ncbi:hypothetical protein AB3M89_05755 [Microbacterium sp. 179-I 3D2 NHS]|uniref:hypothetical protein n=1 Tax=Microbacterium sp. 179-I 3D2 NHS TaxID=3235178 RepID=UPI0039A0166B
MKLPFVPIRKPEAAQVAGRLFITACSLGIAVGVVATAGMLLAAAAFATGRTFVIPLVATFEGFRDAAGTNAVTVTGSWATAVAGTIILTSLLSHFVLRRLGASADGI